MWAWSEVLHSGIPFADKSSVAHVVFVFPERTPPMNSVCKLSFSRLLVIVAIILIPLATGAPALAQSAPSDGTVDTGTHWYDSYDGVHENISLSSGNLSFCIPLVSSGTEQARFNHPAVLQQPVSAGNAKSGSVGVATRSRIFPVDLACESPSGVPTPSWAWVGHLSGSPAFYASPSTSISGHPVDICRMGRHTFLCGTVGPDGSNADTFISR